LSCISSAKIYSFGQNTYGQCGHNNSENIITPTKIPFFCQSDEEGKFKKIHQIAAGGEHSAAVCDGILYTWGKNGQGQLGWEDPQIGGSSSSSKDSSSPSRKFKNLKSIGSLGNLANHQKDWNPNPKQVQFYNREEPNKTDWTLRVSHVSCGKIHTTMVTKKGQLFTWGTCNEFGGLGYNPLKTLYKDLPKLVQNIDRDIKITQIAAGGTRYAIRYNKDDVENQGIQLLLEGEGTDSEISENWISPEKKYDPPTSEDDIELKEIQIPKPKQDDEKQKKKEKEKMYPIMRNPLLGKKIIQISCGWTYTAFVDDQAVCWSFGTGKHGQLGHDKKGHCAVPRPIQFFVENKLRVKLVSCGTYHTGVIVKQEKDTDTPDKDGVYTWGSRGSAVDNFYNGALEKICRCHGVLLGHDDDTKNPTEDEYVPKRVAIEETNIRELSCSFAHSALITSENKLYTWGFGYFGVLGLGDRKNRAIPTEVNEFEVYNKKRKNTFTKKVQ